MSNLDLIVMSLGNLWRRKLRTFLTILGVTIGCASIVVMLSLGLGMKAATDRQLEEMGALDIISIMPYPRYDESTGNAKEPAPLNDKAVNTIKKIEHVKSVLPMLEVQDIYVYSKKYMTFAQVVGVDPTVLSDFDMNPVWGRLLDENDTNAAIFGGGLKNSWYDPKKNNNRFGMNSEPLINLQRDKIEFKLGQEWSEETGPKFKKSYKITPIAELPEQDYEYGYNIFINMEFAEKLNREAKKIRDQNKADGGYSFSRGSSTSKYTGIYVKVDDIKNVKDVNDQLEKLNFNAQSKLKYVEPMIKQTESQQKILGGIGAVSLLVAAIGIANTMVMSIYERIKEIGIMKVIGASVTDIKKIFLTEAALIGLFGGLVGIGFSYGISAIINYSASKPNPDSGMGMMGGMMGGMASEATKISIIPIWLVIAALIFSSLIGLVSGYYPATKATKLSPLEAIRTQ